MTQARAWLRRNRSTHAQFCPRSQASGATPCSPVLAGVFLQWKDSQLVLTATNGFRLSRRTIQLSAPAGASCEAIVPARTLGELARSLDQADESVEILVTASGGQMLFRTSQLEIVSRLIDGQFPDVVRVIPTHVVTRAVLDTQAFAQATKLASHFAAASANITQLTLDLGNLEQPGTLTLRANAAAVGENQSVLEGMVHGEAAQVALNVKYIAEALNAISTSQIAVEMQAAKSPVVFKPVGSDDLVHVVMPMNVY